MEIAIIASSGGSAFGQAHAIIESAYPGKHGFRVVTDRECGIEPLCRERGIRQDRIVEKDSANFSRAAAERLARDGRPDLVLLFFSRKVGPELFTRIPTFNIHPALLPAYKGLGAVARAHHDHARFLGATLHLVNDELDGGPIVAQTCMPLDTGMPLERMERASYAQKVYLTLLLFDLAARKALRTDLKLMSLEMPNPVRFSDRANPVLEDRQLAELFAEFQEKLGLKVV